MSVEECAVSEDRPKDALTLKQEALEVAKFIVEELITEVVASHCREKDASHADAVVDMDILNVDASAGVNANNM